MPALGALMEASGPENHFLVFGAAAWILLANI
jgi:hypothetical protein